MKHIKKLNELNVNTYRRAANSLRSFNKDKRANDLDDWADKKDFGYYNAMFANNSTIIEKSAVFTRPRLIGIYTSNSNKNIIKDESGVEDMVSAWSENECELSLKFEFGFKATSNTSYKHSSLERHQVVPLFSIKLVLCGYIDNYSHYDDDSINIINIYKEIGVEEFFLLKPNNDYFGILSDRVSAFRFIKFLKTIINDDIKDKIMEVLNIIGDTSDLDRILESFNGIRTHGLYSDYSISSDFNKKWYGLQIN